MRLLLLPLQLPSFHPDGAQAQGKASVDPLVFASQAKFVGAAVRVPGGERFYHFQLAAAGRCCALLGNRQERTWITVMFIVVFRSRSHRLVRR